MITGNPLDLHFPDVFFEMAGLVPDGRMLLKLEGFNITGSIKLKSALFMVEHLERAGLLEPGRSTLVESSSGNLGVAVALICRMRGYGFVCVTDPNISAVNLRAIRAYGGRIDRVETKDEQGGYLRTRLDRVARLLAEDPDRVWLNQYANPANARAHARWTALQILQSVPDVTHLYVGTGTTGTMMGLAESFSRLSPKTELVAVEPEGSVTFGAPGRGGAGCPAWAPAAVRPSRTPAGSIASSTWRSGTRSAAVTGRWSRTACSSVPPRATSWRPWPRTPTASRPTASWWASRPTSVTSTWTRSTTPSGWTPTSRTPRGPSPASGRT